MRVCFHRITIRRGFLRNSVSLLLSHATERGSCVGYNGQGSDEAHKLLLCDTVLRLVLTVIKFRYL